MLCAICAHLNIADLLTQRAVRHHISLSNLRASSPSCRLCSLILAELTDSKRTSTTFRRLLAQDVYARQIPLYMRLAEEKTALVVETGALPAAAQTDIAWQTWEPHAVAAVSLPVWTLDEAVAREHGLPWRRVPGISTASAASMEVARGWLRECRENHVGLGACRFHPQKSRYGGTERPTRLIDLSEGFEDLRLVEGTEVTPVYVALSYVWGVGPATWKTVRQNLARRADGFSVAELPPTLRDAISVTHALGLRLCWIDAVCIVQDDAEEWERESVKMDVIYSSAVVTVMASHSQCSVSGLFNENSTTCDGSEECGVEIEGEVGGGQQTKLLVTPPPQHQQWLNMVLSAEIFESKLFERGWCFQEWILSPRKLFFSSSQLFWECSRGCLSEDGLWTFAQHHRGLNQALMSYVEGRGRTGEKLRTWSMAMNMLWYFDAVSQSYSPRDFTHASDRLIALSGLAKLLQSAVPSKYLAGIWEHSLPGGLCWRRISGMGKCPTYVAPSWSWASQLNTVEYEIDTLDPKIRHAACDVLDAWVRTKGGDEMGLVTAGGLVLRGPTFAAKIILVPSGEARTYEVDEDAPYKWVVCPTVQNAGRMRWYIDGLVMDDDTDAEDLVVTAMTIWDDTTQDYSGMLILKEVAGVKFQRVGFLWAKIPPPTRAALDSLTVTQVITIL